MIMNMLLKNRKDGKGKNGRNSNEGDVAILVMLFFCLAIYVSRAVSLCLELGGE
jgi:hypothetical protein